MKSPSSIVLSLVLMASMLMATRAEAALDCTFGAAPFGFGSAEPIEASLDSDILSATPLFGVISGLEDFEPRITLGIEDITCERSSSGFINLQITNLALPPVIGSTSYNGRTYDVYASSESWAGFIIVRTDAELQNGAHVLLAKAPGQADPRVDLNLGLKYIKLADPLTGTVGELVVSINVPDVRFDLTLPDNRSFAQRASFYDLPVYILGVVCNLLAPHELDLGDIAIADLRVPGTVVAQLLQLQMNCGSGYQMISDRVPSSMQVTFDGGVETGLLNTNQDNVKFNIVDRLNRGIPFDVSTAVSSLTNNGQLTASNSVQLKVKPQLKDINGQVDAGEVTGNLGIVVIYK